MIFFLSYAIIFFAVQLSELMLITFCKEIFMYDQVADLEDGEHALKFKAWDLSNNSTETEIKFTVASSLTINSLTVFPNPVIESTDIIATHNRFGEKMTIEIEIFTQQGGWSTK